jgi:hypothetical protein
MVQSVPSGVNFGAARGQIGKKAPLIAADRRQPENATSNTTTQRTSVRK